MFPRLTPALRAILILNVAFFLLSNVGSLGDNLLRFTALSTLAGDNFSPTQFFTYMFLHANFRHLFGNMLILFFLGSWLEEVWGSQRFLLFYIICGLGAGILFAGIKYYQVKQVEERYLTILANPTPGGVISFLGEYAQPSDQAYYRAAANYDNEPANPIYEANALNGVERLYHRYRNGIMLGASGAVYGVLLALGLIFPNHQIRLLIPPIPIKIKYLVIFLGLGAYFGVLSPSPGDNTAHTAHLAGMLIAFLLVQFGPFGGNKYS